MVDPDSLGAKLAALCHEALGEEIGVSTTAKAPFWGFYQCFILVN